MICIDIYMQTAAALAVTSVASYFPSVHHVFQPIGGVSPRPIHLCKSIISPVYQPLHETQTEAHAEYKTGSTTHIKDIKFTIVQRVSCSSKQAKQSNE